MWEDVDGEGSALIVGGTMGGGVQWAVLGGQQFYITRISLFALLGFFIFSAMQSYLN